jgi:hypothetical protein
LRAGHDPDGRAVQEGRRTRQHRWTWMKDVSPEFLTESTRFWETGPEVWKMLVDTSVNGPFFMARALVPGMLEAGGGSLVNVSINYEPMKLPRVLPVRSLEGRSRVRERSLRSRPRRDRGKTQRAPARRSYRDQDVAIGSIRGGALPVAAARYRRRACYLPCLRRFRPSNRPPPRVATDWTAESPKGPSPLTAWEPKTKDRCGFRRCCCRGALTITTVVGERSEPPQH